MRTIPSNKWVERAVLGALILQPDEIFKLDLEPSDFSSARNRNIYRAILALLTENQGPSFVSILDYCQKHFGDREGLASYIAGLTDDLVSIDLEADAALIREAARQRKLQVFLKKTLDKKWGSTDQILEEIQGEILKHQLPQKKASGIRQVAFRLHDQITVNWRAGRIGQRTGFKFLDKTIKGFIPAHLWIVGGYTGVGKTAFMIQLVVNSLLENPNIRIGIFSTEMPSEAILLRFVANRAGVPAMAILQGGSIPEVQKRIDDAFEYFQDKGIWLYDDLYTFEKIFLRVKQLRMTEGLDIVFIDFLQNMHGEGTLFERMSTIPVRLQQMAKNLDVCVIAMSQVSNEAAQTNSRVIGFKGAGEIAAASDLGLWLERDPDDKEALLCSIRKNRHGMTGKKRLRFVENFTRIIEVE